MPPQQPPVGGPSVWRFGEDRPDQVLTWARGSVCVFPQDHRQQLWVPERLTRAIQGKQNNEDMDVPVAGNAPASEN